jgi:pyruvate,orthophosphate dikinase
MALAELKGELRQACETFCVTAQNVGYGAPSSIYLECLYQSVPESRDSAPSAMLIRHDPLLGWHAPNEAELKYETVNVPAREPEYLGQKLASFVDHLLASRVSDAQSHEISIFCCLTPRCRIEGTASGVLYSSSSDREEFGYVALGANVTQVMDGTMALRRIEDSTSDHPDLADWAKSIWVWIRTKPERLFRVYFTRMNSGWQIEHIQIDPDSPATNIRRAADCIDLAQERSGLTIRDIDARQVSELLRSQIVDPKRPTMRVLARGTAAAHGAAFGGIATSKSDIDTVTSGGKPAVFVADEPRPEDIEAILQAEALIFGSGGLTSHVAVIARSIGKPCIVSVDDLSVDTSSSSITLSGRQLRSGELLTVDGNVGEIFEGQLDVAQAEIGASSELAHVLAYCDERAQLRVYANADTAEECQAAMAVGAVGIGLCRLEHLLARPKGLKLLQRLMTLGCCLLSTFHNLSCAEHVATAWPNSSAAQTDYRAVVDQAERLPVYARYVELLDALYEVVTEEVFRILSVTNSAPVVIRLIDPPLHEFLSRESLSEVIDDYPLTTTDAERLGHLLTRPESVATLRGIRLGILFRGLVDIQLRAITEACLRSGDSRREVGILIPFVSDKEEVIFVRNALNHSLTPGLNPISFKLGAMIETPRSAVLAGEIAGVTDFIAFGTNDLTQYTWAVSRDAQIIDFLNDPCYRSISSHPYTGFDREGLGGLIEIAVRRARDARPDIELGVCGEVGGNPSAIQFFHNLRLNYVSCGISAVPVSRLAAAQAALRESER